VNDNENARAAAEARETVAKAAPSSRRADIWAGLVRYLGSEARHQQKTADHEREQEPRHRDT
jgi:hypothetical protein